MLHSHDQFGRLRAQKKRNKNTPNTHSHTKETVEDENNGRNNTIAGQDVSKSLTICINSSILSKSGISILN